MSLLLIAGIALAWIVFSGFLLITVSMMSSLANRTELLPEDQLPRRRAAVEHEPSEESTAQPSCESPTW